MLLLKTAALLAAGRAKAGNVGYVLKRSGAPGTVTVGPGHYNPVMKQQNVSTPLLNVRQAYTGGDQHERNAAKLREAVRAFSVVLPF